MMKFLQLKSVQWILATALAVLFYLFGMDNSAPERQVKSPCSEPLTFRVGEIDERYSVTENELAGLMKDVAGIWSDAADTTIVLYDEDGEITVNLIYAEEQQLSDSERQYRNRLEDEEFSIVVLENEYTRMNQQYEEELRQYQEDSQRLKQSIDRLNQWVVQKNEEGGFNEQELTRFESRKIEIDNIKQELAQREIVLKKKANELNNQISFLNQKIEDKNKLVDQYNRMFSGERKFTQGSYEWKGNSRTINIFHFIDRDELKLVIAHEMGHALGIGHVSNPTSVMHELMGSQIRPGVELTDEDIRALQNACSSQIN